VLLFSGYSIRKKQLKSHSSFLILVDMMARMLVGVGGSRYWLGEEELLELLHSSEDESRIFK
jgi:hypothetical protein